MAILNVRETPALADAAVVTWCKKLQYDQYAQRLSLIYDTAAALECPEEWRNGFDWMETLLKERYTIDYSIEREKGTVEITCRDEAAASVLKQLIQPPLSFYSRERNRVLIPQAVYDAFIKNPDLGPFTRGGDDDGSDNEPGVEPEKEENKEPEAKPKALTRAAGAGGGGKIKGRG